ncbi:MAG: cysteine desulfurase [Planctomycetota bacterium]|nr:cysteine desulfurase [Planctomycetota bacterium]
MTPAAPPHTYDVTAVRADFPILAREVNGKPLVYLDNAATTQRPEAVVNAIADFYRTSNSNVHRGVHRLSQEATELFEAARTTMARFLGADTHEIVFTRGTTEGINLVAAAYGRANVGAGDEIVVSRMEHHANIVPWQLLCEQTGARLRVAPITDDGALDMDALAGLIGERTKIVAVGHISNALGTINPIQEIARLAHAVGAIIVVDGAQGAPHGHVDVRALDVDFYALSGHKMYGPTGIGVVYGRKTLLDAMPPWQGGGDMIRSVTFEKTTYNDAPFRFEAGTPNIAGAIGLAAAADYLRDVGLDAIAAHEAALLEYGTAQLAKVEGLRMIGTAPHKAGVLGFVLEGIHPHDIGTILDSEGVAVRTGHHCAQPVMERFGVPATARASLGLYNTPAEIDALVAALTKVREVFA